MKTIDLLVILFVGTLMILLLSYVILPNEYYKDLFALQEIIYPAGSDKCGTYLLMLSGLCAIPATVLYVYNKLDVDEKRKIFWEVVSILCCLATAVLHAFHDQSWNEIKTVHMRVMGKHPTFPIENLFTESIFVSIIVVVLVSIIVAGITGNIIYRIIKFFTD
ncbi:MAG: hypothetical protein LBD80_03650 [Tannerella sp.]|jgi:multisubunit Na+/H+ antiporter MnhB subunit|nr:hypothetical protein [Tannerella sp.]